MLKTVTLLAIFLPVIMALPLICSAQTNLVEHASVWVSSVKQELSFVDDRWLGPAAVRDGLAGTAYLPASDLPFEILVRFHSTGARPPRLQSVTVSGSSRPVIPESFEFAGIAVPVKGEHVTTSGLDTTFDLSGYRARGYLLRLRFPGLPAGAGISGLKATSAPCTSPAGSPGLEIAPWKSGLALTLTSPADALFLEVMRSHRGSEFAFPLPAGASAGWDRPPEGEVSYVARAVAFDGTRGPWSDPVALTFTDRSPPAPRYLGCVEGFYGRPWLWKERISTIRFLATLGMNSYLYAPKDDPFHRERWREQYPEAEMEQFKVLLETGGACGIDVVYCISPGLDMNPASEEDFSALTAKLLPFISQGYRSFGLLMDDIKAPTNRETGGLHAKLTTRLHDWLRTRKCSLMFVGTVYAGTTDTLSRSKRAYTTALSAIPQEVPIMWTGQGVFDAEMSPAHIDGIAALLGRKPLIWDNFPVNDYFYRSQRLFLGPVTGRGKKLMESVTGLLSNPMTHQVASRLSLMSYGGLFSDPGGYRPAFDRNDLPLAVEGSWPVESFELFIGDHFSSPKMLPDSRPLSHLSDLAAALLDAVDAPEHQKEKALRAADPLVRELAARYVADSLVWNLTVNASFNDEIWAAVSKRRVQLETALESVALLASSDSLPASPDRLNELHDRYEANLLIWRWFGLDEAVAALLKRARSVPRADKGRSADFVASLPPLPESVAVGTPVRLHLAPPEGTTLSLYSGDGAGLDATSLEWTPTLPGYARLVIVYRSDSFVWPRIWRPFVREPGLEK